MIARAAAIVLVGFVCYFHMLPALFRVMDDRISIIENPAIKSVKNAPAMFREGYFHDQSYYRPLVNLTFMAEYQAFGLDSFYYNLDNLILHILNALLVFLLAARLTRDGAIGFWSGLLFVLHPVQWEAVCNVPGRSILLSAFFVLCSFTAFLAYDRKRSWWMGALVLALFFAGLLCKESAGVLPLVILAYLSTEKTRPWAQKITGLWPFIFGLAGYVFLRRHFGMTHLHQTQDPMVFLLGFVTFLRSVITDLRLFILPIDLHYDRCLPFFMSLQEPRAWGSCVFWLAVLAGFMLARRRIHPFVYFLAAWFWIELLPVSQIVTSIGVGAGHVSTAEHFLYLACVPVLTGMVMAFQHLYALNIKNNLVRPVVLKMMAAGFLVFLLLTAMEQSIYASNEYNMVSRSLAIEPDNPRLQAAMAMLSVFRNDIPDAEKHFRAAIKAEPRNPAYHIGLGTALCQQKKWIEGLEQFVAFDPGKDKDLVERQEKMTMGHIQEELNGGKPYDARGWLAIGIYYAQFEQPQKAIEAFHKSAGLNPGQADAWFNLGSLYEALRDWPSARAAYKQLLILPTADPFQKAYALKHLTDMYQK